MSNSTTLLDTIISSQASKEVTANALFDASSPATLYGRRASTTAALTWGYYGGVLNINGTLTAIPNGTVALSASSTNYVEANPATGAVTKNTTGFTSGYIRLYTVVTGASTITSYTDWRALLFADQRGQPYGVASLDASGLIPISQIPPKSLERLVVVADQAARYALTTSTVQNGDTVKQNDTGIMYLVKDDTNLGNSAGYEEYVAGSASSVPVTGVTGLGSNVSTFLATPSSANLAAALTDETGTGSAVFSNSPTLTGTTTAANVILAGVDLTFHTPVGTTISDVFVYDTSKDSDGGAWVKRCQHTSWYKETIYGKWLGQQTDEAAARAVTGAATNDYYHNLTDGKFYALNAGSGQTEVFRGNKREFPRVAIIVAEPAKVVIYDATDSSIPMWMVFGTAAGYSLHSGTITSISYKDCKAVVGMSTQAIILDMCADNAVLHNATSKTTNTNKLAYRNSAGTWANATTSGAIVNATVNSVAITTLPDAPIDSATGLPVPTIAVATAGGTSVINNDGVVRNSAITTANNHASFDRDGTLYVMNSVAGYRTYRAYLRSAYITAGFTETYKIYSWNDLSATFPYNNASSTITLSTGVAKVASGSVLGFSLFVNNQASSSLGMVTYISKDYNTGWMVGDIRRCWLADNYGGSLSGVDKVAAAGVDGTFAASTGWTAGTNWSISGGYAQHVASTPGYLTSSNIGLVAGRKYALVADVTGTVIISSGTADVNTTMVIGTQTTTYFTAGSHGYLWLWGNGNATLDNLKVYEVVADRSTKSKPLSVVGTLTRTAYTGGRTVYSGFSSSNYLQEASHADWNAFGTGGFSIIMSGVKWGTASTLKTLFSLGNGASNGSVKLEHLAANTLRLSIYNAGWSTICTSPTTFTDTAEHVVEVKRYTQDGVANTVAILVDGLVVASAVSTLTISNATGYFIIGEGQDVLQPWTGGQVACVRISATAPTAEQSKFIADTENKLNNGAPCLLAGTSDGVVALAHDEKTDLLDVYTSYGRSTFKDLQRVESEATTVGTPVSASAYDGVRLQAGTSAKITMPVKYLRDEPYRTAEDAARRADTTTAYSFTSSGTTQKLPQGMKATGEAMFNSTDGTMSIPVQTFDGFIWTLTGLTASKVYTLNIRRM